MSRICGEIERTNAGTTAAKVDKLPTTANRTYEHNQFEARACACAPPLPHLALRVRAVVCSGLVLAQYSHSIFSRRNLPPVAELECSYPALVVPVWLTTVA
jgi:hypothetical protein